MKVAVYLDSTLELLGVVECDRECYEMFKRRRVLSTVKFQPTPAISYQDMTVASNDTAERIDFEAVTLQRLNGAVAVALLVKKREHLAAWEGRQVWPRKRDKRDKLSKSERKWRREHCTGPLVGTSGHILMVDDPHGNGTPRS